MVKGECKTNSRKLHYGLILDRVGLLNDMSFVMKDGSLYPVTTLQLKLAQINGMVKRKMLVKHNLPGPWSGATWREIPHPSWWDGWEVVDWNSL